MESFDIQVLLKDGSFADYEVKYDKQKYEVSQNEKSLISFIADEDGTWSVGDNKGDIDEDLQERIINQLKGFKM